MVRHSRLAGGSSLALKIGVISPKLPHNALSSAQGPSRSSFFWFDEIEAGFAFLLHDNLHRLYIDRDLIDGFYAYTSKYLKQIEQLHPHLEIAYIHIDGAKSSLDGFADFYHFPKLDTLFKNGDLKSVFQPIVEAQRKSHALHGIECLSRFYYQGRTFAPEFIFNYASEKLKLTSCDKICLMQALSLVPHDKNTLIFINLRPQTLISADFLPWFKSLLKQHQLVSEQIVIEVTEQYCNISEFEMSEQCKAIKNLGLRLAIDDFGSGISNLTMLEVMRPSYIKISGRFIKNSHEDVDRQKIIKNVLQLAADFGIAAIVESVEMKQEWEKVEELGARLAQGFYFYRPMDRVDLDALIRQAKPSL